MKCLLIQARSNAKVAGYMEREKKKLLKLTAYSISGEPAPNTLSSKICAPTAMTPAVRSTNEVS